MKVREQFMSQSEGIALSVLTLAGGGFVTVGISASAPFIRVSLGLSAVGIGAIASMAYLGAMLTARIGGRATDRLGPIVVISVGMAGMAMGVGLAALAPSPAVFYLGVLIAGLGYGTVNPATNVLANPDTARRRGFIMSVKQSGVPLGGIAAGAVLPSLSTALGWRVAFVLPLLVCLGTAFLVAMRGRLKGAATPTLTDPVPPSGRLRLPHGFAYGFASAGAQVSLFAFTAVYLTDGRALPAERAGLGVSSLLVGGVVGRPLWGWISDLYPSRRLLILQITAALGAVAITSIWTVPVAWLPVALPLVGVSAVGWNGVYVAAVAEAAEPRRVGTTTGASLTMINLGAVICPIVIGLIVQLTGIWAWGWLTCSALCLMGWCVIFISRGRPEIMEPSDARS